MKTLSLLIGLLGSFFVQVTPLSPLSGAGTQDIWADSSLVRLIDNDKVLAEHSLVFAEFNQGPYADEIMAYNVLRYLNFLQAEADCRVELEAGDVFAGSLVLEPGEVFAFHPEILTDYQDKAVLAPETDLSVADGYKTLVGLSANGVCYLASLFNWVASEAGLEVVAKVNHDFSPVPGVPREFGTSIYHLAGSSSSGLQNLYIRNPFDKPIELRFGASAEGVVVSVYTKGYNTSGA